MSNDAPKMQSWQFFHFARKHLGRSALYAIFGKKNARAIDYWCENPRNTAKSETAYNPLQGIKDVVDILDDQGHCDVVKSTIAFLAADTSCDTGLRPEIVEPLPTITEEILADYRAVAALQQAIEAGESDRDIESRKLLAIAEIERTVARYLKDCHE